MSARTRNQFFVWESWLCACFPLSQLWSYCLITKPKKKEKRLKKIVLKLTFHQKVAFTNYDSIKFYKKIPFRVNICHTCQLLGKPGKRVAKAPLRPLPIVNVPFSSVQIDCVGPLPRSSGGHEYLLTIICLSTRYPEAIPLRSIKADKIVKDI